MSIKRQLEASIIALDPFQHCVPLWILSQVPCYYIRWITVHFSASLLCPWNSLGKSIGVGCHALLQGILPFQGLNSSCMSPALAGRFFTTSAAWDAPTCSCAIMKLLSFVNLCKLSKDTHTHIYMYTHTQINTLC